MKSIKGTQTEKNLMKSFAGESQARMRIPTQRGDKEGSNKLQLFSWKPPT